MINKKIPILVDKKKHCCGCGACYSVCPKKAIKMVSDNEGFLYPKIDEDICIGCLKCENICVFKQDQKNKNYY